jgi:hypothetical protein
VEYELLELSKDGDGVVDVVVDYRKLVEVGGHESGGGGGRHVLGWRSRGSITSTTVQYLQGNFRVQNESQILF